ncbi:phospholipid/glycerol acyltransferase [Methylobacterium sp. 4-46]|nr:phospholipid/glycerol acyltransferase [Methylobacterium sp. 4-46]
MSGRGPDDPTRRRSALAWRFMAAYFDRYLRRHLTALRLSRWGAPDLRGHPGPLVVYCNHPAWWDAAVLIVLAERCFPDREGYAPFDAQMLAKYGVFGRIGAFGVDPASRRGAAAFLTASRRILSRPERALWVTAQGRFSDVRERPLGLRPGVAHLPEVAPDALFLPLALEYAFWSERGAEAFAAFGPALAGRDLLALPRAARLERLEGALTGVLDRLSADVMSRDPARFVALTEGRRGVGGIYDLGRRVAAALAGRRFEPGHGKG